MTDDTITPEAVEAKRTAQIYAEWAEDIAQCRSALAAANARADAAEARAARMETGLMDREGTPIRLGDRVLCHLEGPHTKPEYWNPEYVVEYKAPSFVLKHVGGGKGGDNSNFRFRNSGHYLTVITPPDTAAPPAPRDRPVNPEDEGCGA